MIGLIAYRTKDKQLRAEVVDHDVLSTEPFVPSGNIGNPDPFLNFHEWRTGWYLSFREHRQAVNSWPAQTPRHGETFSPFILA
jgi:hypothetical protein